MTSVVWPTVLAYYRVLQVSSTSRDLIIIHSEAKIFCSLFLLILFVFVCFVCLFVCFDSWGICYLFKVKYLEGYLANTFCAVVSNGTK